MPSKIVSKATTIRDSLLAAISLTPRQLQATKVSLITDAARARLLGVAPSLLDKLVVPIVLSPAHPIVGTSNVVVFSTMMVDPTWPVGSGQALFSSGFPAGVDPGVQVSFPRIKTGHMHLVEFYVTLNMNIAYKFRVFTYPLGDYQDVTIQGPKSSTVIAALAPPVDQIPGALQLGACIQQRNTKKDDAGWSFQSVQINTTT